MSNTQNIFEMMKDGREVRQDHPQYSDFMDAVASTLKLTAVLNSTGDVNEVRKILKIKI